MVDYLQLPILNGKNFNSVTFRCNNIGNNIGEPGFMQCSNCGKCCKDTEMELSSDDIKRLEEMGYSLEEFAVIDNGVTRLRNVDGWCYFYRLADKKCRVYRKRPLGCYLYPVVHLINAGAIVDELCPMGQTITEQELSTKGKILNKLLKKIDNESTHPFSSPLG